MNVKPPCINRLDLAKLIQGSALEAQKHSIKEAKKKRMPLYLVDFSEFELLNVLQNDASAE